MRLAFVACSVALLAGCSWTSDGGLTGRMESSEHSVSSAEGSWDGSPIRVHDETGVIQIVGVPGKTNITVKATFLAGANSQADADAAFADLGAQLAITKQGGEWVAECTKTTAWHGSVDPESTGCSRYRIEVPAGTPLAIVARADYGGVHVSGVTVKSLSATAVFGLVADVTPTDDATIELAGDDSLVSGFCSSVLRLPSGTAVEALDLSVRNTEVKYVDVDPNDTRFWPGVEAEGVTIEPRTASYSSPLSLGGTASAKVKSVRLHADMGKSKIGTAAVPSVDDLNQCNKYDPIHVSAGT